MAIKRQITAYPRGAPFQRMHYSTIVHADCNVRGLPARSSAHVLCNMHENLLNKTGNEKDIQAQTVLETGQARGPLSKTANSEEILTFRVVDEGAASHIADLDVK
jgi:hypothetical protein